MTRECTNQLLEMIDEGLLDARDVVLCCLKYMSEKDVRAMCAAHGIEWQASGDEEPDELDPIPDAEYADRAAADYAARVTSGGNR
jgi:hypothetical protein